MIQRYLAVGLSMFVLMSSVVFAQDEDIQSMVDYKVQKMQKELALTDAQTHAVKPIIKDYMVKHQAILEQMGTEGIVDHVAVKGTLKQLKDYEYQQLRRILNEDQMKRWVNKENLMASMNPDGPESALDEGASLNGNGMNLKF